VTGTVFREATEGDWEAIWPIFREVVSAGDTYAFSPDMGETEARHAWMPEPARRRLTYVAEREGVVVGTAYLQPNQAGPGDHVANAGWMVAPASAGRGIGRAFAGHVIDEARRLGFGAMQFNAVVATNRRAIALWQSLGFRTVGTVPDTFRHPTRGLTPVHVMYREL